MKTMNLLTAICAMMVSASALATNSKPVNAGYGRLVPPPYLVTIYVKTASSQGDYAPIVKTYSGISNFGGPAEVAAVESCMNDGNSESLCKNAFYVTTKSLTDNTEHAEYRR